MGAQEKKNRVALLSVVSNSTLVLIKLIVGVLIGSVSVISEAIHSGMDLAASLIAWFSVVTSSKPADQDHPFGHGKIENISGTVEAILIFIAAGWIIYEAARKFIDPEPVETAGLGVAVMLVSAVANMVIAKKLSDVGKETDSIALQADAWHLRTDVYTSMGVMAGLAFIWAGQWIFPGYELSWLDPLCALTVAFLIIKAAYDLIVKSSRDLLDANLPVEEQQWIRNRIEAHGETICGYHCLRTRKAGPFRFVEFHIQVDRKMTVETSHRFAQQLTRQIKDELANATVTIHIEPCTGECVEKCLSGCLLNDSTRSELIIRQTSTGEL